jgi:hypothetical protein
MPLIEDKDEQIQLNRLVGVEEFGPDEEKYSTRDKLRAAFRLENSIGSLLVKESGLPDGTKETDFDVWQQLDEEEKLDEVFVSNIAFVDNLDELNAVRRQRDRERRDREILSSGAFTETMLVGMADPINAIPVGGVTYKTYKSGGSILQNFGATATTGALATTGTEAALHLTQMERTFGESALNVTASTLLTGIIGATPATVQKYLTPKLVSETERVMHPEKVIAEGGNPAFEDTSIGAAVVDTDAKVRGRLAQWAVKNLGWDPLSRTISSDSSATRRAVNALAENPLDMDKPLSTSVESMIKSHDGKYFEAMEIHDTAFKEYKRNGGTLNRRQFNQEVGRAMRNPVDDPFIQKSADGWRTKLYDPLKEESIKLELLPEDLDVATAESYLNRVWNKEEIAARMPEFVAKVTSWLDEQSGVKIQKKADVERLDSALTETEKTEASLSRQRTTAEKKIAETEKQLEEVRAERQKTIERGITVKEKAEPVSQKQQQLEIIEATNPAPNETLTWIRSTDDIRTAEEVFSDPESLTPDFTADDAKKALDAGEITVYSSNPIKDGSFVTPSRMEAESYAGGRGQKIYSKKVNLSDVAWIDELQGQYAKVKKIAPPKEAKAQAKEISVQDTRLRNRSNVLQKRLEGYQAKKADLDSRLQKLEADRLKTAGEIEKTIEGFPSKIANEVRAMLKAREGVEARSVTRTLRKAIERIKKVEYEDVDNEALAREIAGRIMSTPDGRLPYDYKIGENSAKGMAGPEKGVFKKRSFLIPDSMVEEFLESDIELLGGRYLKQIAPDIELKRRFDDVEMKSVIKDIEQDYALQMQRETDPAKRRKLNKKKESDIRDVAAMRDRIRGTYGQVDWDNPWVRAGRVARDLNYMRLLGGVVAASFPDFARVIMAEGIVNTFSKGLKPLVTNLKGFKMAAREAKLYGVGTDALMGGRAEIIADVADYARGGTKVERLTRAAATKFSSINLMNQWTGGIKQLHAVVTQTRIIDDLKKGIYDKRLGQLGISEADAKNILAQINKYGEKMDGVWVVKSKDWDNQALAQMWGAALRKESDRVIIMPGQEKPLFMSSELGKTIFQFRTFMFSATQRVLFSSLQAQDKHYIQGLLGLVSIGMMSYAFKEWDAGRDVSDDPAAWVAEGIDRAGILGYLMEINNTVEKVSGNNYGLRPLFGVSAPAARYASRNALDSVIGPTFGLMQDGFKAMSAITGEREWSDSDTRAIRRLLPGQNLSVLRQGFDIIEQSVSP